MRNNMIARFFLILLLLGLMTGISGPLLAVMPEEQLANPALEERARTLSRQLRCLVCQNQSIDDSDADLARDLRIEVRRQLIEGKDDQEILDFLQSKYGDFILLNPPFSWHTGLLWISPIIALICGAFLIFFSQRRKAKSDPIPSGIDLSVPLINMHDLEMRYIILPKSKAMVSVVILLMLIAFGLYWFVLGSPKLPPQPFAQRADEITLITKQAQVLQQRQIEAIDAARSRTASQPDNIEAWLALGLAAANLDAFDEEINALRNAVSLAGNNLAIKSMLAEALNRAADGQVTPEVRELIDEILDAMPNDPRALYLLGLAHQQEGNYQLAISVWQNLASLSPPNAPFMPALRDNILSAAKDGNITLNGPSLFEDMLTNIEEMSEDERKQMIEGMVGQLHERLESQGGDIASWLRLVRSYDQLERGDEALKAHIKVAELAPENLDIQLSVLARILANDHHSDYAESALMRAQLIDNMHPEVLFFGGHFAKLRGQIDEARSFWSDLLATMPVDSEAALLLIKEIDKL